MQGIILLAVYAAFMIFATTMFARRASSLDGYLVAGRNLATVPAALSIASAWIWAPSLFVSAEKAYTWGLPGLFWFTVPNFLCLLFFIPFAKKIRATMPQGVTLSGFITAQYKSKQLTGAYLFQLGALSICSTGVQLLAGGKMLALLTGLPFEVMVPVLAVMVFLYSHRGGIRASWVSNGIQMAIILAVCFLFVPWLGNLTGGLPTVAAGMAGASGEYGSLGGSSGWEVFAAYGLSTTIGLLSGPFGDQTFWQKAFTIKRESIGKAFALGALLFLLVPLSMGSIGYMAAGSGFVAADAGMVNLELIKAYLPAWATIPLILMLLSGLLSTVDNNLCSAAALTADIIPQGGLAAAKWGRLVVLLCGILIAFIPGLTVASLFMFYGTLRATTLLPTIMTLRGRRPKPKVMFICITFGLCVGLPIFAFGELAALPMVKCVGSLAAVLLPSLAAIGAPRKEVAACE